MIEKTQTYPLYVFYARLNLYGLSLYLYFIREIPYWQFFFLAILFMIPI